MPSWMDEELANRRRAGLGRRRRRPTSAAGPRVYIGGREYVNFASNDYLNLAADPRLARAAARAAARFGSGAGASPLVSGYSPPLRALERSIAAWEESEAALVFSSGYAANVGVVTALAGRTDAVFSDELNHASLVDGCRLSRADVRVYRHRDLAHLDELLGRHGPAARRRVVVSDTVFSMDGDVAPLAHLVEIARRHDALLVIDEAHATGVIGARGTGVAETLPPASADPDRIVKVGTLSKALGAQGGFVCGSRVLVNYLVNVARPYIYSTALAPPVAAAARQAVAVARNDPARRERLVCLAVRLRSALGDRIPALPPGDPPTPIIPVTVGEPGRAVRLSRQLQQRGLLVPAIRPPTVPAGTSRLRISLSVGHTDADLDRLVDALSSA